MHGTDELASLPELVDYQLYATAGETVPEYTKAADKLGYLLFAGDTCGKVVQALSTALRALRLDVRAGGEEAAA